MVYLSSLDFREATRLRIRPRAIDITISSMAIYAVLLVVPCTLEVISYAMLSRIAMKSFWGQPLAAKAAVIFLFSYQFVFRMHNLVAAFLNPAWLVGAVAFVCAKRSTGDLSTLEIYFAIFSIVGNIGTITGALVCKYIVAPRLYNEWLSVFEPTWSDETEMKWFERGKAIASFAKRVLERVGIPLE
jgi:hypothetical protein